MIHYPLRRMPCLARFFIFSIVFLCLTATVQADFVEGWRAYQQGDFATALQHWTKLAKEGDPVAQYNVGVMYDEGTGVDRDAAKVVTWWNKAAEKGHLSAQHNLALLYIERSDERDFRKK